MIGKAITGSGHNYKRHCRNVFSALNTSYISGHTAMNPIS